MIAADPLAAMPLVLTGLTGVLGGYAVVVARRNERHKDQSTERIDLLGASQQSLKEALERADAENDRARAETESLRAENDKLRGEILRMRNEHEVDRVQWKAKFEAQDRELDSLRLQVRACQNSLALLSHNTAPAKDDPLHE